MVRETMNFDNGEFSDSFSYSTELSLIDLIRGSRKSNTFVRPGMTARARSQQA